MTTARTGIFPFVVYAVFAALAVQAVHVIIYLIEHGAGAGFDEAMAFGGHHGYWVAAVAATALATGLGIGWWAARVSLRRAIRRPSARRVLATWLALLAVAFVGFVGLENLETVHGDHPIAGVEPVFAIAEPGAAAAVIVVCGMLAVLATTLVGTPTIGYESTLARSYAELVAAGVYTSTFTHLDWATTFFRAMMTEPIEAASGARPLRLLECGSGTGVWLAEVGAMAKHAEAKVELRGFDLSPDMTSAARERLASAGVAAEVRVGDVLDPDAYRFDGDAAHDLVFAYDLVQQLPRALQARAATTMFEHVAPGGRLVIFDHDRHSRYGRIMGTKKWLRRYLRIPLVPHHYIHAAYPDLGDLKAHLERAGAATTSLHVEEAARHRALVATRST